MSTDQIRAKVEARKAELAHLQKAADEAERAVRVEQAKQVRAEAERRFSAIVPHPEQATNVGPATGVLDNAPDAPDEASVKAEFDKMVGEAAAKLCTPKERRNRTLLWLLALALLFMSWPVAIVVAFATMFYSHTRQEHYRSIVLGNAHGIAATQDSNRSTDLAI